MYVLSYRILTYRCIYNRGQKGYENLSPSPISTANNDTSTTQPPHPLPLINVGLPLKQRLGHCPAFKATLSEGEGGVKVCCSSGGVFLK